MPETLKYNDTCKSAPLESLNTGLSKEILRKQKPTHHMMAAAYDQH